MYKYVLFDLDGTLTDPEIGISNCVKYALDKFGIHVEDKSALRPFIGPPLMFSFQEFYGLSEAESKDAVRYYRERFSTTGLYENQVYDGIVDLLEQLKARGKVLVLATSKPEEYAIQILKHFNLYDYFDYIAGATMDGSRDGKVDVIHYAIELSGITNRFEAIMVGDRHYDVFGAKECGIDSVGVLYGFGSYNELVDAGANYIAESVEDILKYIE